MLDLGKAVIAQKEDEIKNGQKVFMKRLIAAAIVFFIVVIVGFIVQLVAGDKTTGIVECLDKVFE
jgi:preprotein translocase subunit Sss1